MPVELRSPAPERLAAEVKDGLSIVRRGQLDPPGNASRLLRVAHGAATVPGLLRMAWSHPATRQRMREVLVPQAVLTVGIGLAYALLFDELPEGDFHFGEGGRLHISRGAGLLASLYTTLSVVEWCIIAFTREFHDEVSARIARLVGVPVEPSEAIPRLGLSLRWCWNKLKRRVHGALIFAAGLPVLALLMLVPVIGDHLYAAAVPLWAFYWLAVFTIGKTMFAWTDEEPGDPWFLRRAARVPGSVVRRWVGAWRRITGAAARPAVVVERLPWEAAGLAVMRILGSLPGVYVLIRPFIPVAATFLIGVRAPEQLPSPGRK